MYKPLILAAMLVAQAIPPMGTPAPMMPMRPMPAMGLNDGITVSGNGYASAQATDATLMLHVSSRNNATSLDAQSLQPIVDALVRAGVDPASVQLPSYLVGNAHTNNATITASVHHPTLAMLQQGMVVLAGAFAAQPALLLNEAQVTLSVAGCSAVQRSALASAIANAKANAQFIAKTIGARVGPVLAVDERTPGIGSQGACTYGYTIGPYGPPAPSAADMLTVKVYAGVGMRFAIER
jgi:hypothetical protein